MDGNRQWRSNDIWLAQSTSFNVTVSCLVAARDPIANWTVGLIRRNTTGGETALSTASLPSIGANSSHTAIITLPRDAVLPPGDNEVFVQIVNSGNTNVFARSPSIRLHVPLAQSIVGTASAASHQFAGDTNFGAATPVNTYRGFARFSGKTSGASQVRLMLVQPGSPEQVLGFENPVAVGADGAWKQSLQLAGRLQTGGQVQVFVLAQSSQGFSLSQDSVILRDTAPTQTPLEPRITGITSAAASQAGNSMVYTKDNSVSIAWEIPNLQGNLDAVGVIEVEERSDLRPTQSLKSDSRQDPVTLPLQGSDLSYTVRARVYQGDRALATSAPWVIKKRTTGPQPREVSPSNLAETPGLNVVRISFNPQSPLDLQTITADKFRLDRFTGGQFAEKSGAIRIVSKTSELVTLSLGDLDPGEYRLVVQPTAATAKIKDLFGNDIIAATPSTDGHIFAILKPVGSELPTQDRGLKNFTGPNIEFPEYTKPRPSTAGFNPSDKVVTRVARLYYNRDAHRVTQLVNRDARSYNRQAVTQQQQLADNARRDAENFTDERRMTETLAIRAAQQARNAEKSLTQAQEALTRSTQQLQTMRQQTLQTSINLREAQQAKAAADAKVQGAQAEVKKWEEEITKLTPPTPVSPLPPAPVPVAPPTTTTATALNAVSATVTTTTPPPTTTPASTPSPLELAQFQLILARTSLAAALREQASAAQSVESVQDEQTFLQQSQLDAQTRQANAQRLVDASLAEISVARQTEVEKRDQLQRNNAKEDRAMETLFRREVAAAHEDPDTYAPARLESPDPVLQVSLSVVGEGVIQLRGPLKGVNLARMQIHDLDSPVGAVRVAVHTIQVNGERGERMEPVVERIQRYVDHSRFLTSHSAQMLRQAVTQVAARRAEMVFAECEGMTQEERDQRYIDAFFGRQFLDELRTLDSEFIKTGNKILSLHSMDTTSLAQALFLMALAKNDVRMEILNEFEQMVTCQLPLDETRYFSESNAKYKTGHLLNKQKFKFFGQNAHFVSLRGFFNAEIAGPDTITPLQREFIRLAQIFKSRLVTEVELQQRIMERAIIEDRFVDFVAAQREAAELERQRFVDEKDATRRFIKTKSEAQQELVTFASKINAVITRAKQAAAAVSTGIPFTPQGTASGLSKNIHGEQETVFYLAQTMQDTLDYYRKDDESKRKVWTLYDLNGYPDFGYTVVPKPGIETPSSPEELQIKVTSDIPTLHQIVFRLFESQKCRYQLFSDFRLCGLSEYGGEKLGTIVEEIAGELKALSNADGTLKPNAPIPLTLFSRLMSLEIALDRIQTGLIEEADTIKATVDSLLAQFNKLELINSTLNLTAAVNDPSKSIIQVFREWMVLRDSLRSLVVGAGLTQELEEGIRLVDEALLEVSAATAGVEAASKIAILDRRGLDHKKFLDMLVDDVEDKYIELLEGTRAQVANVDNYISRIITALDDDFNTQFYHPAFQQVRLTSQYYDVSVGQVETTTVLTNNRQFAKVSPQAMMEFDLPKRDILISEAFEAAGAVYQDYGALLNDPTFMSLTKLYSGQPTSTLTGAGMPNPVVRDVLPGLPSATNERLLIQEGAAAPDFPSALESLIPDPAIYKFETGTGFEIRPVLQPDGQAVTFHLNYMYTTNIREPVRADEKHLGRIKRQFIDTDVQLGNFELREVSKYQVALKASRTSRGVPLLEDVPVAGILFRPLPQQQSSLQQNIILSQATIFPTLFDLMGLRWAPAVADLDALRLQEQEFVTRHRQRELRSRVFDYSSKQVDDFLRIQDGDRRPDLYRSQESIPLVHPNGYHGQGLNQQNAPLREGANPQQIWPTTPFAPGENRNGRMWPADVPPPIELAPPSPGVPGIEISPPDNSGQAALPSSPRRSPASNRPAREGLRDQDLTGPQFGPITPVSDQRQSGSTKAGNSSPAPRPSKPAPALSRPSEKPGISRLFPTFHRPTGEESLSIPIEPETAIVTPTAASKSTTAETKPATKSGSRPWFRLGGKP